MVPALPRLPDVNDMIDGEFYFVLHAPRQSGKTTYLKALTDKINSDGLYYATYCALHSLRSTEDAKTAMDEVVAEINAGILFSKINKIKKLAFSFNSKPYMSSPNIKVRLLFTELCQALDRELVVFFDEADCLLEKPLISFLSQIKEGFLCRYDSPDTRFPRSMALVGIRDIKDYLSKVRSESESKGPGSPFNVKRESLTLTDFSLQDITHLYGQHTAETGQIFEPEAVSRAWHLSEGQPWLVNALADDVIVRRFNRDLSKVVTATDIERASQDLILRHDSHFDSLVDRLMEPRIRKVIEPVIIGSRSFPKTVSKDDVKYVIDLGLLKKDPDKGVSFKASNPIYGELIHRALSWNIQNTMPEELANQWMDGTRLDMNGLLKAFQVYWRENSEASEKANDKEIFMENLVHDQVDQILTNRMIATEFRIHDEIVKIIKDNITGLSSEDIPHLVLNAFLQRVMNGAADYIHRECSLRRSKVDILVSYKNIRYPIELKIKGAKSREKYYEQLFGYMDKCGSPVGWLIIFNMNPKTNWNDKLFWETLDYRGKTIHVVGC
jgi:hypothetical protein